MTQEDTNTSPEWLEALINDARDTATTTDYTQAAVAYNVAKRHENLYMNSGPNGSEQPDNLEVIKTLRDRGSLCTDELESYREQASADDIHEARIEAIARRTIEEFLMLVLEPELTAPASHE